MNVAQLHVLCTVCDVVDYYYNSVSFLLKSADSANREMTDSEIKYFQDSTSLIVLPIANVNSPRLSGEPTSPDGREGIKVCIHVD